MRSSEGAQEHVMRPLSAWLVTCAVAMFAASATDAQTARSGGTANAQLLQQLQQLASDRTSLQAENAQLKKDLEALRKERDALKKGQQGIDQRVRASEAALAQSASQRQTTEQELKQSKDRMQQLVDKFKETIKTMQQVETEGTTAKQTLATRERELKVCVDHNKALYQLNDEILTRLEHPPSAFSRMASAEPFTKIKRVQLENLVDDYRGKADDERLDQTGSQPPASVPGAPPASVPKPPSGPSTQGASGGAAPTGAAGTPPRTN
jgi:chromosome segregation ATPase